MKLSDGEELSVRTTRDSASCYLVLVNSLSVLSRKNASLVLQEQHSPTPPTPLSTPITCTNPSVKGKGDTINNPADKGSNKPPKESIYENGVEEQGRNLWEYLIS